MYIDIEPNDNLDQPAMATFKETGPGQPLRAVRLWRGGAFQWCAITGWSETGPVPASITPIEESGDGPARLLHGGSQGLRLRAVDDPAAAVAWSTAASDQWAEPFLLCRPEVEIRA